MAKVKVKKKSWNKYLVYILLFLVILGLPVLLLASQNKANISKTFAETPIPVGQTGNWNMIFSDEFEGASLDLNKWIMCNPSFASSCNPWNNEKEKFNVSPTNNPNVVVNNGMLHLITTKTNTGQIMSGMVSTGPNKFGYNQPGYKTFQYTYGYYEGRIKFPRGNGFWPSLWMLPDQDKYGAWPGSGEYDVVEMAGNNPTQAYMTEHDGTNGGPGDGFMATMADSSTDFHVYGFDWQPDHLAWYIDGVQARPMICTDAYAAANPGKCNSYRNPAAIKNFPFYIIANFSVGGNWPPLNGAPDATTPFPASMDIDYLRVWQRGPDTIPTATATPVATSTPTPIPTLTPQPTATPPVIITSTPVTNILKNGSFESVVSPWYLNLSGTGKGSVTTVSDTKTDGVYSVKATITGASSNWWTVQFKQDNVPLVAGKTYTISFKAKASKNHQIQVPIQKQVSPYTVYYQPSPTITTTWQQYNFSFKAPTSDNAAFIGFNLGQTTDIVWLDGITLTAQ